MPVAASYVDCHWSINRKLPGSMASGEFCLSGSVLVSHRLPPAVQSALKGLTSGFGMEPGVSLSLWPPKLYENIGRTPRTGGSSTVFSDTPQWTRNIFVEETSPRSISIGQLHALLHFHVRPINPVVYRGPYHLNGEGTLILKRASHLDAFSGYHFPT